jgi:lipid II:glycine glycyltransferase (peptidoglycan interpeptide bridge formation enzyme)
MRIVACDKRRKLGQALKKGLTYEIRTDWDSLQEFYKLHLQTRKKLGVPIQPFSLFRHIYENLFLTGMGFCITVNLNKKVISAGVLFCFNRSTIFKFSASDSLYLNYRPNNLLYWAAIKEAMKRKSDYLDMGRTDASDIGLRNFKIGWGAEEQPLISGFFPSPKRPESASFLKEKVISPIIRNSPEIVCKTIGQLAYKYSPFIGVFNFLILWENLYANLFQL